jgi:glycosyltransferase involved in cell wall biosynthesis
VCTRDRPSELRRCLGSLSKLRYSSFEVLVVDNASTDSAAMALAREFGARYVYDPVPGLSHARNVGACVSKGDFIAYLDDDAVADPDWLDAFAVEFEDPQVAVVVGRCLPLKIETEAERQWAQIYGTSWAPDGRLVVHRDTHGWFPSAAFGGIGTGGSMAFRHSAFDVWPGFNERLGRGTPLDGNEEHHAFFSLVRLGFKVVRTPNAIVHHPCPPTLDALRARRLRDSAAFGGFLCLMMLEAKGYRIETIRHILRKLRSGYALPTKPKSVRLLSMSDSFFARLRGPWLYVLASWRAHKNNQTSSALVPFLARALSQPQVLRAPSVPRAN